MFKRAIVPAFGACLILLTVECLPVAPPSPAAPDRSFCAISAQAGQPKPTLPEIASLKGMYRVALYSADSGKKLDELEITLIPTDTLQRFYQRIYEAGGAYRLERRKEELLAYGGERHRKWEANAERPPVALYYSDKPVVALFTPPRCGKGSCVIEGWQTGLLLNIKQVKKQGFAGAVDQIGTGSAMKEPGQPWRLVGPHFFCALKEL
jgi:hypothetical protein